MKKVVALFIAVMLIFGIFAGCSGDTETIQSVPSDVSSEVETVLSVEDVAFLEANNESV